MHNNTLSTQLNCCIIINCIRDTNDQLYHHLPSYELEEQLHSQSIQVVTKEADTVELFFNILAEIHDKINANNLKPWSHIFCHGNEIGFQFNYLNETLTWSQMAESFSKINKAMSERLFINLTCCKGANFKKLLETNISSFYELIGLSNDLEIEHAKLINKEFYTDFLQNNNIEETFNRAKIWLEENGINTIEYFKSNNNNILKNESIH